MLLPKSKNNFYRRIASVIFFIFCSPVLYAATIRGNVVDQHNGEILIGAVLHLSGTSYETASGLDGSFVFKNIPSGKYQLVCEYLDYMEYQHELVVTDDSSVFIPIHLQARHHQLDEVTVVGQSDRESEEGTRKTEQKADNVMNVIGAKAIQYLPDVTVGGVLQRVSGVSVQRNSSGDGQYAIIRGMDKRYNYTLVNGIKIPSPDNKNRYVPMDIFPAEMLERLEVTKALTPNMEGDAIGGAMNLIMKTAPTALTITANASGGYSALLASRPFSGFATKDIPQQSPAEVRRNQYVAKPGDFNINHLKYDDVKVPVNALLGLTIGNRILKNKLGFIVGGSYQRTYRATNTIFFHPNSQPAPDPTPNSPLFDAVQDRKYSSLQTRSGVHAKLDYFINDKNKLSLYNVFMQMDEALHRHMSENLLTDAGYNNEYDRSRFQRQRIYNSTLHGDHAITQRLKIDWSAAYSLASGIIPDWTDIDVKHDYGKDAQGNRIQTGQELLPMTKIWTHNKDEDKSVYLNLNYSILKELDISAGGLYRHKSRSNYYTEYNLNTIIANGQYPAFTNIQDASFNFFPASDAYADTTNANNYTATENITAGYVQTKIVLAKKLQILGGVRAEKTFQHYNSALSASLKGKSGTIDYLDLLPSLHLKYIIGVKQNVRFSYYKAISRPGFFELVPAVTPGDFFDETGNYRVKHTQADNFDLRYELFPKSNEQLLVGIFYKNIQNPIEYGFLQIASNASDLQPQNFGTATNYGFELVYAKYIRNWGISGNYTYTKSSITTLKKVYGRDAQGNIVNTLADQTRPLQGQSDHIANISFIYKNAESGLNAQLAWVYTGKQIRIVSPYKDIDYWQKAISQLDFSAEKKVGFHFSIFVKATNLLNTPVTMVILHSNPLQGLPEQKKSNEIVVQKDVFRQTFLLGVRYKL